MLFPLQHNCHQILDHTVRVAEGHIDTRPGTTDFWKCVFSNKIMLPKFCGNFHWINPNFVLDLL